MSKFLKGFVFGGVVSGVITLLNTQKTGKENREKWHQHIENAKHIQADVATVMQTKKTITESVVPQLNVAIKDMQATVRHFTEDNRPHFKRIQTRLQLLKEHLENAATKD